MNADEHDHMLINDGPPGHRRVKIACWTCNRVFTGNTIALAKKAHHAHVDAKEDRCHSDT